MRFEWARRSSCPSRHTTHCRGSRCERPLDDLPRQAHTMLQVCPALSSLGNILARPVRAYRTCEKSSNRCVPTPAASPTSIVLLPQAQQSGDRRVPFILDSSTRERMSTRLSCQKQPSRPVRKHSTMLPQSATNTDPPAARGDDTCRPPLGSGSEDHKSLVVQSPGMDDVPFKNQDEVTVVTVAVWRRSRIHVLRPAYPPVSYTVYRRKNRCVRSRTCAKRAAFEHIADPAPRQAHPSAFAVRAAAFMRHILRVARHSEGPRCMLPARVGARTRHRSPRTV
ncbi:hypothetical protein C8Q80DRAFT_615194 [Daedaleopsis nitida]|nr:hypothetical protein C8Q80DRAFT_615194 [Daedaleopsis nitida]